MGEGERCGGRDQARRRGGATLGGRPVLLPPVPAGGGTGHGDVHPHRRGRSDGGDDEPHLAAPPPADRCVRLARAGARSGEVPAAARRLRGGDVVLGAVRPCGAGGAERAHGLADGHRSAGGPAARVPLLRRLPDARGPELHRVAHGQRQPRHRDGLRPRRPVGRDQRIEHPAGEGRARGDPRQSRGEGAHRQSRRRSTASTRARRRSGRRCPT